MRFLKKYYFVYFLVIAAFFSAASFATKAVETWNQVERNPVTIVIDAGHGGEDGGAVSCTGALESGINLSVSLRLEALFHLLGYRTEMIRREDTAVYTPGAETISEKKSSDLRNRVQFVNGVDNALLLSIHQNHFEEPQYRGAQVFYAPDKNSRALAEQLQTELIAALNPGSRRQSKPADSVYLMKHAECTAVLVECGFLSNPQEEALLRSTEYQCRICCVVASAVARYLETTTGV